MSDKVEIKEVGKHDATKDVKIDFIAPIMAAHSAMLSDVVKFDSCACGVRCRFFMCAVEWCMQYTISWANATKTRLAPPDEYCFFAHSTDDFAAVYERIATDAMPSRIALTAKYKKCCEGKLI